MCCNTRLKFTYKLPRFHTLSRREFKVRNSVWCLAVFSISSLEQNKRGISFDILCLFSDIMSAHVYYTVIDVYNLFVFWMAVGNFQFTSDRWTKKWTDVSYYVSFLLPFVASISNRSNLLSNYLFHLGIGLFFGNWESLPKQKGYSKRVYCFRSYSSGPNELLAWKVISVFIL